MPKNIKPLSVRVDYRGKEPQFVIDGTDYAGNIVRGSVTAEAHADGLAGQSTVTVTFVVDDLRIMSGEA